MVDVIIIGAGPAGLTAAIYLARAGRDVLIIEKMFTGGQMATNNEIANYPGAIEIGGSELALKMEEQAKSFGAKVIYDEVIDISLEKNVKKVTTSSQKYEAKSIIVASGAKRKKLGLENEEKLTGRGVSYCAVCDGGFFKGKITAVIGGGNTALEDASYLSALCQKVFIIHRRNEFRAYKQLVDKVMKNSNVEFILDSVVENIIGEDKVTGLKIKNMKNENISEMNIDGVFIAIGTEPETNLFKGKLKLCDDDSIITDEDMRTSFEGVFAAGDVRKKKIKQVITAAADGAIAAESANQYLSIQ